MKSLSRDIIFLLILLAGTFSANAQVKTFMFEGRVVVKFDGKESPEDEENQVVHIYYNKETAQEKLDKYKKEKAKESSNGGKRVILEDENRQMTEKDGKFIIRDAIDGMTLIATYGELAPQMFVIKESGAHTHNFSFEDSGKWLKGAHGEGKKKKMPSIPIGKSYEYGDQKTFNLYFNIPTELVTDESRMFISPFAVDCQTEDTVAYLPGLVVDASKYHELQERRMAYDFEKNDSVRKVGQYMDLADIPESDGFYNVHYEVTFKMPKKNHAYKCNGNCTLEDYTHEFYRQDGTFGSCNSNKPFRFYQWNLKAGEIPLTRDYYEQASTKLRDVHQKLKLLFENGTDRLIDNKENDSIFTDLITRLKHMGRKVVRVEITGYASPEGNLNDNLTLASKRAGFAKGYIGKYVTVAISTKHKARTWEDVDSVLIARGDTARSKFLRGLIAGKGKFYQQIKTDTVFTHILEDMRSMEAVYYYTDNAPLKPEEALDMFKKGENYPYNNGDYYAMLELTEKSDPKTFKAIINHAYQRIVKEDNPNNYRKFATFIANRKGCYSLEDDENPDTTIIIPFLDKSTAKRGTVKKYVNFEQGEYREFNDPNMVALICCMALKQQELRYAEWWAQKLPADGGKLETEINNASRLIETILHWGVSTEEQRDSARAIAQKVMDESPVNKAVLQTELLEELQVTRAQAVESCRALPDDDYRKWYLLAMNYASKEGLSGELEGKFNDYGTGFKPLSEDQISKLSEDEKDEYYNKLEDFKDAKEKYEQEHNSNAGGEEVPTFLAYLQHSFDIKPSLKRYYAYEALVDDKTKEKYPYNPYKQVIYRKKFASLK